MFQGLNALIGLHPHDDDAAVRAVHAAHGLTGRAKPWEVTIQAKGTKVLHWGPIYRPPGVEPDGMPDVAVFLDKGECPGLWVSWAVGRVGE